jgi:Fe-S cluster assembly iron-binding protein IscA
MKITENAFAQMKTIIKPDSGLAEGIRIAQGNGCCGPSFSMSIVKQPYSDDLKVIQDGINLYLDNQLAGQSDLMVVDYFNERFQIMGINQPVKSGCC